jgi:hypothetical protein
MNDQGRNVVPQNGRASSMVTLGALTNLDLSFLPDAQRDQLMTDYAKGVLDVAKKAHELHVDVAVLKSTLEHLAATTNDLSDKGNAVTITHSQRTKVGVTEIKMGNTDEAKSGKMSRSQTGEKDWTPYYVIAGIIAVILIAFLFAGRH